MRVVTYMELGLCNCAKCDAECLGEKTQVVLDEFPEYCWPVLAKRLRRVACRIKGRPYCNRCTAMLRMGVVSPVPIG